MHLQEENRIFAGIMSGQPTDLMKGKVVFELAELKGAAER
jgi:hypothetical protein